MKTLILCILATLSALGALMLSTHGERHHDHHAGTSHHDHHPLAHHGSDADGHHHGHDHQRLWHGKPGAEVMLQNPGVQLLNQGQDQALLLQLLSHLPEGQVRVTLDTSEHLHLVNSPREWLLDVGGITTLQLPVMVHASANGRHHLHVLVQHLTAEGIDKARALALEFRVGEFEQGVQAFNKHTVQTKSHPSHINLPGQEMIF